MLNSVSSWMLLGLGLLHSMFFVSAKSSGRNDPRLFSEEYVEGLYGRIFEYSSWGNAQPCPRAIDHFNKGLSSPTGTEWIVPHDKIVQDGALCDDSGVLALNSFGRRSKMPTALDKIRIARETFDLMAQDSTGFWMGADSRICGKWKFPMPTYIFFVKEFDRDITTSFRVKLGPSKKYMFVISDSFTCIYVDVKRQREKEVTIVGTGNSGPSENAPTTGGSIDASGTNMGPGNGGSSSGAGTGMGGSDTGGPKPTQTPNIVVSTGPGPGSDTGLGPDSGTHNTGDTNSGGNGDSGTNSSSGNRPAASPETDTTAGSDGSPPTARPAPPSSTPTAEPLPSGSASAEEPSIIDIANGAKPPSQTVIPDQNITITDIAKENGVSVVAESSSGGASSDESEVVQADDSDTGDGEGILPTSGANSGESLCFPGNATVQLRGGHRVRMDRLHVGDEVLVGKGIFSPVFMFSHSERTRWAKYTRLSATSGLAVELTDGHLIYASDRLVEAREVHVGDWLVDQNGKRQAVQKVEHVWRMGVFNPQTMTGDVVVDGVITSAYTMAVGARCGHTLLAPARVAWRLFGNSLVEWVVMSSWGRSFVGRWVTPMVESMERAIV